ncbi:MAG: AtpZ/AtpI family protein [Balneolaceae bacterium]
MVKDPNNREYLRHLSLGLEIAGGLSIPILIGYWVDIRLDTSPWFLLLGAFTGILILSGIIARLIRNSEQDQ